MNQLPDETPFEIPADSGRKFEPGQMETKRQLAFNLRGKLNRLEKLVYDLPYERYKNTVEELDHLLSKLERLYLSNRPPDHWTPEMQLANGVARLNGEDLPYPVETIQELRGPRKPYVWKTIHVGIVVEDTGGGIDELVRDTPEIEIVQEKKELPQ